mgnify:CR=1 FL=1
MNNYVIEFKEWLEKQKYKPSVVKSYVSLVQNMVKKFANSDWKGFSDNAIYLLAAFYEISNREYYLDRVTTWYALDYFDKVSKYIHHNGCNLDVFEPKVTLHLFDGTKENRQHLNYYTTLNKLGECLKRLAYEMYEYKINNVANYPSSDELKFFSFLQNFKDKSPIKIKDAAIHITYDTKSNSWRKIALSRYCDFFYAKTKNKNFLYPSNDLIQLIQSKNPNKTIDGCFKEIIPITGFSARQVKPDMKIFRDTDKGYVYSTKDIAEIFNIEFNTASDLMNRFGGTFKIQTVLRGYYSDKATNVCLKRYHHYKNKKASEKYSDVDYNHSGYEWWYNRKKAMQLLGIKKAAFYSHIAKNCLYINYAEKAPKYYAPELEYLRNTPTIRRIRNRKIYKKQNIIK